MACQGKVLRIVRSAVLLGYYVFNVVRELAVRLGKEAVLATIPCSLPHELPRGRIHHY
jgi:hypothetical protein